MSGHKYKKVQSEKFLKGGTTDTIEVTYLNGKRTPTLESKVSWDTLGIEWRMYHDFGINVLDYRGVAYNQGK